VSASHTNHTVSSQAGSVRAKQNKRRARLLTIRRVSLYLTGALALLAYLPTPALMAEVLAWIALTVALIGIAAIVQLVWIDRKQTHYG
jgi:Na+/proline symporter